MFFQQTFSIFLLSSTWSDAVRAGQIPYPSHGLRNTNMSISQDKKIVSQKIYSKEEIQKCTYEL